MKFKIMLLFLAFNFGSSICSDSSVATSSSVSSCTHPKAFGVCMICSASKPSVSSVITSSNNTNPDATPESAERVNSSDNSDDNDKPKFEKPAENVESSAINEEQSHSMISNYKSYVLGGAAIALTVYYLWKKLK